MLLLLLDAVNISWKMFCCLAAFFLHLPFILNGNRKYAYGGSFPGLYKAENSVDCLVFSVGSAGENRNLIIKQYVYR